MRRREASGKPPVKPLESSGNTTQNYYEPQDLTELLADVANLVPVGTVAVTVIFDEDSGQEQVIDREKMDISEWSAFRGSTLSVSDTGSAIGQAYRVDLVAPTGAVLDSFETTAN